MALGEDESAVNLIQMTMSYAIRVMLLPIKMVIKQIVHTVVKKGQHVIG
jgi:hypothetical protein